MGFESRAISARKTKQIVTIYSKTCDNTLVFSREAIKLQQVHCMYFS